MITPELFWSAEDSKYYYTGVAECTKCHKNLHSVIRTPGFLLWDYYRTHLRIVIFCLSCKGELEKVGGKYSETKSVIFTQGYDLPTDSIMAFPDRPELVNSSNLSVFDVAVTTLGNEKVIDNTIHANKTPLLTGKDEVKRLIKED